MHEFRFLVFSIEQHPVLREPLLILDERISSDGIIQGKA